MFGDTCVNLSTDAGYGSLSKKKCGKQVCVTKRGRGGQDGTQKVVELWSTCIEVGGDYVEKLLCTVVNKD